MRPFGESSDHWAREIRARLASLSLSPAREAEIIEELSQHLDQRYEELRACGTSDTDARRLTIDELLDRDALANQMRALRQAHTAPPPTPGASNRFLLPDLGQDIRYAVHTLRKQPGFAIAAVVMLSLGIGATTAIFSVVNSVLIRPLAYPDADQLVRIVHAIGGSDQTYFSDAIYVTYLENTQAFQDLGVWVPAGRANVTGQGEPEEVRALTASRGILTTLGVRPEAGRWFSPEDDTPAAPDTVILSHGYWLRKFGGDRGVIGQFLTVDARPHQIIGVMPAQFGFRGEQDIIRPLRIDRGRLSPVFRLNGIARLKPGVTLAQASADAARVLEVFFDTYGANQNRTQQWQPTLRPLKQDVVGDIGNMLWVLLGGIGVVLMMACANVANLLLVRGEARRHEFSVRAALGARWTRLARAVLVESLMLALVGGLLGLAVAYAGLRLLIAAAPSNLPRLAEISLEPVSVGFALAVSVMCGLLFGLMPILKYTAPHVAPMLGSSGRAITLTRERHRSQNTLIAVQIALAVILLVSAGLMIRSFEALRRVNAGFVEPHHVQSITISIPPREVAEPQRVTRIQHEIIEKIAAIPGVASAAFTTRLPMDPTDRSSSAMVAEDVPERRPTPPNRHVRLVSPGMFQTLGTPLVAGRDFSWTDLYESREVAIVSENLAREIWGSAASALGKRIREFYDGRSPWREVIGVAGNVHDDGAHVAAPATVYWPAMTARTFGMAGYQPRRVTVAIRSERTGTESLLNDVSEAVRSVQASLPLAQVRTLGEIYGASMARTSFTLVLLATAAAMALLLGLFGIYGVISYAVSQRRREIGIRLALGARTGQVRNLFVRRAIALVTVGVAIGLGGALASTRLMQSLLFGIGPLDPVAFTAMPALLAAAAMLASYLSARAALAVDPMETLRSE
jgi:predicted permease